MPYVKNDRRDVLDVHIKRLIGTVRSLNNAERNGNLNYVFTKLLLGVFPDNKYHEISEAGAVLESCKQEWYRRRMGPREDQAIFENGDVYPNGIDDAPVVENHKAIVEEVSLKDRVLCVRRIDTGAIFTVDYDNIVGCLTCEVGEVGQICIVEGLVLFIPSRR